MPDHPPTLVFSHGNSFPGGTYSLLFERWREAGWRVHAIDRYGHDPRFPVTRDWPHLARQLHHTIEHDIGHPVWLVGHSMGGYLSLMEASRHPEWVQGVIVLDSPLVHGWKSQGLGLAKSLGLMPVIMPSRIARQRRHQWPDLGSARQHFLDKKKFAAFHPRVLEDYLQHTIQPSGTRTHHELTFSRDIESAIYDTVPHRMQRLLMRHPPRCPTAYIAGTRSRELRQTGMAAVRKAFGERISWIEGSHLYPMEKPLETAELVLQWLNRLRPSA